MAAPVADEQLVKCEYCGLVQPFNEKCAACGAPLPVPPPQETHSAAPSGLLGSDGRLQKRRYLPVVILIVIIIAGLLFATVFINSENSSNSGAIQAVTTYVATSTISTTTSVASASCPASTQPGPTGFPYSVGDPVLTNSLFIPYNGMDYQSGGIGDVVGVLYLNSPSQVTTTLTSDRGVELFVFCSPTAGPSAFTPPGADDMTGYVFSSGAAYSVNVDVALPPGVYCFLIIDPANSASHITLTSGSITPLSG